MSTQPGPIAEVDEDCSIGRYCRLYGFIHGANTTKNSDPPQQDEDWRCPPPSSRMRRLAPAVAAMLAFLTLAACGGHPCEQPLLERVVIGGLTVGWSELGRAVDCPGADELNDLKIKAREGDPDAQAALGEYYFTQLSPFYPDRELVQRSAAMLLRCAAEGGSHAAQGSSFILGFYLEEPDASKIIYKYSKIAAQRAGCDCNALFQNPPGWLSMNRSTNLCYWRLCSPMRDAAEKLSPTQITEIEDDISVICIG